MAKKKKKQEEVTVPANDIPVLLKVGDYFIPRGHVQKVFRFGKGCKIMLITGDELLVRVNYNKVVELVG